MRALSVSPISYNIYLSKIKTPKKSAGVSFSGSEAYDDGTSLYSCFFRDFKTLKSVTDHLVKTFPDGATILNYGCSDGQEAYSIYLTFDEKERDKYKIRCLDVSDVALSNAEKKVYQIGLKPEMTDNFLIEEYLGSYVYGRDFNEYLKIPYEHKDTLKRRFFEIMEFVKRETKNERPVFTYTPKEEYRNLFEFDKHDIKNINTLDTGDEKVGAIFFRNSFYQLVQDKTLEEKESIARDMISKIYDKLDYGGVFVIGDSELGNKSLRNDIEKGGFIPESLFIYRKPWPLAKIYNYHIDKTPP